MEALAGRLRQNYPRLKVTIGSNDPAVFDVVVNATPLGMNAGDPMPVDVSRLAPSTYVGEVVMKQETTAFLAAARARGCETQIGIDMLFEQIPAYLEFFGFPSASASELRAVAEVDYDLQEPNDCSNHEPAAGPASDQDRGRQRLDRLRARRLRLPGLSESLP